MKHHFYLLLVLVLLGCQDNTEDVYKYSKVISQPKEYSVYLDMSDIGNIQVTAKLPQTAPFKIVSNDHYYFVGDMLKGIHVYEKKAGGVSYLCFIACRYIKDFDLVNNQLFCNNLTDLLVLDVSNPLQTSVLYRQKNQFNQFSSYKSDWNIPYVEGKGLVAGSETHVLIGTVTDKKPTLDFTDYDQLYGNLTTKVIPDTWFSNHPENDKPYIGIIKINTDEIYTYGTYNSWAICTYRSGTFSVREEDLWTTPRGKYIAPYYYSDSYQVRMFFDEEQIFILGSDYYNMGYADCITYNESNPLFYHLYFPNFRPIDITYMPAMQAYIVLSGQSVGAAFIGTESRYMTRYLDYKISTDASSIFRKGDQVVTIGNKLSVYFPSETELKLVKEYPDISGTCYSKAGDVLAIANTQGLFIYDISNLESVKLIP
jgi:hypothetical protein